MVQNPVRQRMFQQFQKSKTGRTRTNKTRTKRTYNVELDGLQVQTRWDDGDTFSAYTTDGEMKKKIKHMNGYNTLESYGPVHFRELEHKSYMS